MKSTSSNSGSPEHPMSAGISDNLSPSMGTKYPWKGSRKAAVRDAKCFLRESDRLLIPPFDLFEVPGGPLEEITLHSSKSGLTSGADPIHRFSTCCDNSTCAPRPLSLNAWMAYLGLNF
ncbi:hypothetical protein BSKO_12384 [Bryopsis sp. KO-2023]|nr:hypothetical protein BSKO_12384 [Bryopsis sp. KO-2023]